MHLYSLKRVTFQSEDIGPFPLHLLTVWSTVLQQPFLHHYISWDLTQTKSQWEKKVAFLMPSNCYGIHRFLMKWLEIGLQWWLPLCSVWFGAPCITFWRNTCSLRAWVLARPRSCAWVKSRSQALVVFAGMFIPQLCSLWKLTCVNGSGVE